MHGIDPWLKCIRHDEIDVYIYVNNPIFIQMYIGDWKWLSWDENGCFRLLDTITGKPDVVITLNYHPKIKPEEAKEYFDRMLAMKVFS